MAPGQGQSLQTAWDARNAGDNTDVNTIPMQIGGRVGTYGDYQGLKKAATQDIQDARNAIKSAGKAVDSAQNNTARAAAHNLKGTILSNFMQNSKEFSAIETEFRLAVQDDPSKALYHFNLARVLIREQKDDAGKPELEACLAAKPDPELERKARILIADPSRGRETFSPEFQLRTINGDELSLHQFAGRAVQGQEGVQAGGTLRQLLQGADLRLLHQAVKAQNLPGLQEPV